jgi:N-acetylglucosamine kinase-like BadF-type ATPase
LNQAGVLIITDDAEFTREITARWQQERMSADVTLATSDVWATAIGERHDVVIVGPLSDEITEALLEALAEQCASTVIFVSLNERILAQVAHYHPNVVTIARKGDWAKEAIAAAGEALGRSAEVAEPHSELEDSRESERCAALGRYMLEARPRWNNALTSVLGNADLLLLEPATLPESARDQVQAIQTMALRLNEIMQRFSTIDAALRTSETNASQAETYSAADAFAPTH